MANQQPNPFQELIHVLKHNGSTSSLLKDITGPRFFNLLKKAGWDEAHSGKGETHIYKRLCDPTRGGACRIHTVRDFASALEGGFREGPDKWVNLAFNAEFTVNWDKKRFVTFFPYSAKKAPTKASAR